MGNKDKSSLSSFYLQVVGPQIETLPNYPGGGSQIENGDATNIKSEGCLVHVDGENDDHIENIMHDDVENDDHTKNEIHDNVENYKNTENEMHDNVENYDHTENETHDDVKNDDHAESEEEKNDSDTDGSSGDSDADVDQEASVIKLHKNILACWAAKYKIKRDAGKALLNIMKTIKDSLPVFPKDFRTITTVPRSHRRFINPITKMSNGEYIYLGIRKNLRYRKCSFFDSTKKCIELTFNTDGVPVAKSSTSTLWPILGYCGKRVFLIALYHGSTEPENFNEFFRDFVNEVQVLQKRGINVQGVRYAFRLKAFVADTKAKAPSLNIKSPGGYYSCPKCVVVGKRVFYKVGKRRVFSNIFYDNVKAVARNSSDYFNYKRTPQPTHPDNLHNGRTILAELEGFDLVKGTIIDTMHARDIGCMRKLLKAYDKGFSGNRLIRRKAIFKKKARIQLSSHLEKLYAFCPSEFARKPRSLKF